MGHLWRLPLPPIAADWANVRSPPFAYLAAGQRAGGTRGYDELMGWTEQFGYSPRAH